MHWTTPFLEAMQATGNVSESCRRAGISSATAYNRRREDADFAAAWDTALEDATDVLEAEARRRAVEGVHEPVIYQGQLTPIFERDADGELVMVEYDTGETRDGQPVMGKRPKQLVIDGKPQWLTVNKRSDALLQFLLKGLRKKYGTDTHEVTGKDGAPLGEVDETKRAARIAALLELAKQRKAGVDDLT
jgi:hypothetical protein